MSNFNKNFSSDKGFFQSNMSNLFGAQTFVMFLIALTTIGLLFGSKFYSINEVNKSFDEVEKFADNAIVEIEKEGYISDKIIIESEKLLNEVRFSNLEIEGTNEKVEPGEDVYIKVTVYNENILGAAYNKGSIIKDGLAR